MAKRQFLLGVGFLLLVLPSGSTRAEVPRKPPPPGDTLQAVLDRIHNHAAGEAWKEPGWKDDAIEAWLDKLVGSVAKAADLPDLKLPVRFADMQGTEPKGRLPEGVLIVGTNVELPGLKNSIVLADGRIDMVQAENCVIVARDAASIAQPRGCLIVAGLYCDCDIDGDPRAKSGGSIIVSRGFANVGSSYGSVIIAPQGLTTGRRVDAMLINTPPPQPSRETTAARSFIVERPIARQQIQVKDLPLEPMPNHPMAEKIAVLGIIESLAPPPLRLGRPEERPQAIVLRFENRRYMVSLNQPILNESDQPVEALRN